MIEVFDRIEESSFSTPISLYLLSLTSLCSARTLNGEFSCLRLIKIHFLVLIMPCMHTICTVSRSQVNMSKVFLSAGRFSYFSSCMSMGSLSFGNKHRMCYICVLADSDMTEPRFSSLTNAPLTASIF